MEVSNNLRYLSLALVVGLVVTGCGGDEGEPAAPPTVTVANPVTRDVPRFAEFPGTTQAFKSVNVRARVSGELEEMRFQPTSFVREGEVLFRIEKTVYAATHGEAEAALRSAKADLARAESDLERIERAIQTEAVSEQELDRAKANRDMAEAAVLSATARLERAALDLSYTDVKSPISGLVSRNFVDVGNLVGSGEATLLATVRDIDPIFVYFDAPEVAVLRLLQMLRDEGVELVRSLEEYQDGGAVADSVEPVRVSVALATDSGFPHEGYVDYLDNTVNPGTGTIQLRAVIPNEDRVLFPGLFVRVRVSGGIQEDAITVEETAIGTDIGGKYVYVVGEGDVVEQRYLTLGAKDEESSSVVVTEGLAADERYIVNGLLRARPGLPVTPTEQGQMDE